MRLNRLAFFTLLLGTAAGMLQSFPAAPEERAAVVCRPVRFLTDMAVAIASLMNDSGRIGPAIPPWHDNAHRACLRIAQGVFIAAAEP